MQSVLIIFAIFPVCMKITTKTFVRPCISFFKCERTSHEVGKKEHERVIVGLHVLSSCVSEELLGSVGRSSSLVISNAERFPKLVVAGGIV